MGELKPCPFCGGTAFMESESDYDGTTWHYIKCRGCGARTRGKWHSAGNDCPQLRAEVRDEWNARTDSTSITASNERNAQLSRLLLDQDREGAALPFDAWAEYAMREGLLDMKGIATDRKTTGTAFAAFAAGWNAAKGVAVMEGDGGLSDGVMAVPANCRQCGRQLRLDGLCVECDYSDGVAAVPMADLPGMARYGAMQAALDALEKSVDNFPANVQHRAAIDALRVALGVKGLVMADGSSLLDYLNVGDDPPNTDEWTKGFHEARRRLHRILAPQLTSGVLASVPVAWLVPMLNDKPRLFTDLGEARAFCSKQNGMTYPQPLIVAPGYPYRNAGVLGTLKENGNG